MTKRLLILTATALVTAPPALAQTGTEASAAERPTGVQDIVVTAQRRSESAQDVPIAITAFSADQLAAQGITNTLELGNFVPNLVSLNNTGLGSANAYYLRGLGNTETIATFDPPVGTYVDDIYLSRQNANNLSFLDVERIEVLRGPQGTLFGRNTTGGAINIIMRDPGDRVGGYAEVGAGRYGRLFARGSIDLPLADGVAVKLSGFGDHSDGYTQNTTTGETINDQDGWGGRIGVKAELGNFTWRGSYARLVANGENILNFDCDPRAPTNCAGRFATTGLVKGRRLAQSAFAPLAITGRKANYGQGNYTTTDLFTSNLGIDVGEDVTVNFITGYVNLRQEFAIDFFDGRGGPSITTPVPPVRGYTRGGFVIVNDGSHKQFTQEIKVNASLGDGLVDLVAGVYYLNERNVTDFADIFSLSAATALLLADRTIRNNTTAWAGYAQADLNITDQITLTAGLRYTDEQKTFAISDNRALCAATPLPATCLDNRNLIATNGRAIPGSQTSRIWTPRFAINFAPNSDILLFISATKGFKSGGWNARGTAASELLPFGPETVWSYEAGVKADLFDRLLRANLTLYHQDTAALQTPSAFTRLNGSIAFLVRNFADYRNQGAELELTLAPAAGVNIFANIGYQNDAYRLDPAAPASDIYGVASVASQAAACRAAIAAGNVPGGPGTAACASGIVTATGAIATPVRTPDWSLAFGGSYRADVSNGWALVPSVSASYRSASEVQTSNLTIRSGAATGTNGSFAANLLTGNPIAGSFSQAHWLVNAGLALKGPDDRFTLSLECANCFDQAVIQSSLSNYSYLNMPMTWTIRARQQF